jgi:hypothetical protein
MSKSFFDDDSSNNAGEKLFATEYLAANKKELNREFTVQEIVLARSGKGYMVHTEYFVCWLWKKAKLTQMLLEALKAYSSTSHGYHLFVLLTNENKDCFKIGCNTELETRWYDLGNGSYSLTPLNSSSTEGGNPFLPHALSPLMEEGETQTPEDVLPIRSRKRA